MMLEWIVSSCLVILVVLLLRAGLGKRISANLRYALWALVLIRLLVPVQLFTSPVAGLQVDYSAPEVLTTENIYVLPVRSEPAFDASGVRIEGDEIVADISSFGYPRLEDGGKTVRRYAARISPVEALEWIWLAGSAALALVLLASNLRFAARLRRVRRLLEKGGSPIPVYAADGLPSPCLFGLFRTAVYVTPQAAENPAMLRHVKAHELTHYRHLDHMWSVLRGAALTVHWWNPLVWLAVLLSRRDGELACDESALEQLGDGERRAYGETLLSLVTARPGPRDLLSFATTMTGGKKSLQERIRRISCKQKYLVSATVAVALLVCVTVVCAFGRKAEDALPASDIGPEISALPFTTDLNRDGIQEQILRKALSEGDMPKEFRLEVVQGDDCIWSDTLDETHGGCGTYFLYQEGGLDYLLEYMPKMQQGSCTYFYRLFHLKNGEEVTDRGNSVEFDINFNSQDHQFDPVAIAEFMEEVNTLIGESELLVNTNYWMLHLEERKDGILYDDILSALNHPGEDLHDLPLREALEIYARQSETHPDNTNSPLNDLLMSLKPEDLDGEYAELVPLLQKADRLSRFHTFYSFGEEEAWAWSTAELAVPIRDGGTLYLLACDSGNVELGYETAEGYTSAFYESEELHNLISETGKAYSQTVLPYTPDLDRDGVPDRLVLRNDLQEKDLLCLQWESGGSVWRETAGRPHVGWNALFLCRLDGEDYLLRYSPDMSSGWCWLGYTLFYLEEGREVVVQENSVDFDIMFAADFADRHTFDPEAIAAFMEEISPLLANSTQLLNTNGLLLGTFEREGKLCDNLSWLDTDFAWDEGKSTLENLLVYRNHCLTQAAIPSAKDVFGEITEEDIVIIGSPMSSVSDGDLVQALNEVAVWDWYYEREGWEAAESPIGTPVEVQYTRQGDYGEQTMLLENGQAEGEKLVRVTLSGQATALMYSENPGNDATYLHDVPYEYVIYVENSRLYELVSLLSGN